MRIGIDAGGTFTDFVVLRDDGRLETFKLRSNPADPASVILAGISRAVAGKQNVEIIHGSTVATNALLERRGARTAFVTTEGFEDLLAIGRQNRAGLYNLTPHPKRHLIPPELCFGVKERTYVETMEVLSPEIIERLRPKLRKAKVESIAVCFLHSYKWSGNEYHVCRVLSDEFSVSTSSIICPEFREYERASTTAINAYVAPLMARYLSKLESQCPYPVQIMQSNGGVLSAKDAAQYAVRTILSGPAGGVVGAFEMARRAGFSRILGFDMGGTSTDVSLCNGKFEETNEAYIDGLPVRVPMLDIQTVGAGGGSIARIDEGGLLRVGPESAGADPGPACYGKGLLPTVTDAHVVLGHIQSLLGGEMTLDSTRSNKALRTLGKNTNEVARGIIRVANANMERAIRSVSVERGHDPRDFALLAFGGSGGLHACALAESLGMKTVLVPKHAGVLSALGMLIADQVRDYAHGVVGQSGYEGVFDALAKLAGSDGERFADLRYCGQSYELTVPWRNAEREFVRMHKRIYGYAMNSEIEVVTLRLRVRKKTKRIHLEKSGARGGVGPAVIPSYGSTILVPAGWAYEWDRFGTMILTRR